MRGQVIGHWLINRERRLCKCSKCGEVWGSRFKRCPSCNALMRNGIITFVEGYDGREVDKKATH